MMIYGVLSCQHTWLNCARISYSTTGLISGQKSLARGNVANGTGRSNSLGNSVTRWGMQRGEIRDRGGWQNREQTAQAAAAYEG